MRTTPLLPLAIITIVLLLVSCESSSFDPQPVQSQQEQHTQAPSQESAQKNCPFNICFNGPHVPHRYFTIKPITHQLSDKTCNQAFEEQYEATNYLCFIKEANPLRQIGQDEQGNPTWQWEIMCGCSYQLE